MDCHFQFIIAPPAYGKTFRIIELMKQLPNESFVFFSPLKALALEVHKKLSLHFSEKEVSLGMKDHLARIMIVTNENFSTAGYEYWSQNRDYILIVDEVHLVWKWSETFRQGLWHTLINLMPGSYLTLALTATLSKEDEEQITQQLKASVSNISSIDLGNFSWYHRPNKFHYIFERDALNFIKGKVLYEKWNFKLKKTLIFCKYRQEVKDLAKFFERKGVNVLSCIGGEASEFQQALGLNPDPEVIIATTVLGHGVNLPIIKNVALTYKTNNQMWWLQMLARGGRDGSGFEVYTVDNFGSSLTKYFSSAIYHKVLKRCLEYLY